MSDINRDKYHAFAVAIMLTTDSGLRADFSALATDQRTPDNLKNLIRHNLYNKTSGVANGQLAVTEPTVKDPDLENVVKQINVQTIVDNWPELSQASTAVDRSIRALLDYDGGSCPGFREQPDLFKNMGAVGSGIPD
ncbi:MAG TPA: hypothetical protein VGG97_05440 [Bryobacteraceae bacterium]|jgi:hypothetical protein